MFRGARMAGRRWIEAIRGDCHIRRSEHVAFNTATLARDLYSSAAPDDGANAHAAAARLAARAARGAVDKLSGHSHDLPLVPTIPLYNIKAASDGWHQVAAPGGYEAWILRAGEASSGRSVIAAIFDGWPLHPRY